MTVHEIAQIVYVFLAKVEFLCQSNGALAYDLTMGAAVAFHQHGEADVLVCPDEVLKGYSHIVMSSS